MSSISIPVTMRAWQYTETQAGLENTLTLASNVRVPSPKPDEHLVKILSVSLNPLDHKVAEMPFFHRFLVPKPAIPGTDFCGEIVKPAAGSALKEGQLIFGVSSKQIFAGAALAEYAAVPISTTTVLPEGVSLAEAAGIPIAGLTGCQSTVPFIKSGSRVFINGGSGGTGIFGIQIAKQAGAHVTTSCSAANVELCKSLGADEVIDYRSQNVATALKRQAKETAPFDLIVDNVGADYNLFFQTQSSLSTDGIFILVAASPSLAFGSFMLKAKLLPGFLGGAKRKLVPMFAKVNSEELQQIARWLPEKEVKVVIDSTFAFEDTKDAIKKLKSHRARGKIIVEVASKGGA